MKLIDEDLDPRRLKSRWVKATELDKHPGSEVFAAVLPASDPGATARIMLHAIRQRAFLALPAEVVQIEAMAARVEYMIDAIAGAPKLDDEGRPLDLFQYAPNCDYFSERARLPSHPTSPVDIALAGQLLGAIGDFEDVVAVLLRYGFPQ